VEFDTLDYSKKYGKGEMGDMAPNFKKGRRRMDF
jgi:hypothetical protein